MTFIWLRISAPWKHRLSAPKLCRPWTHTIVYHYSRWWARGGHYKKRSLTQIIDRKLGYGPLPSSGKHKPRLPARKLMSLRDSLERSPQNRGGKRFP
jgi:hypothetical protein